MVLWQQPQYERLARSREPWRSAWTVRHLGLHDRKVLRRVKCKWIGNVSIMDRLQFSPLDPLLPIGQGNYDIDELLAAGPLKGKTVRMRVNPLQDRLPVGIRQAVLAQQARIFRA